MKNLEFKTFSIKKLLTTILYTVIISVFVGTTILFLSSVPEAVQAEMIGYMEDSENIREIGKNYEEQVQQIEKHVNESKELYGEDYPAEGILLYQFISKFSTDRIVKGYLLSLSIGIVVGTIIYIVAVQKNSPKKVIIELMFALAILLIMASVLNAGYEAIVNKALNEISPVSESFYSGMEFNINNVLVPYIIIAVVVYIVNMIRQRMITNKLNKQLNKKTIDSRNEDA